jgi:hypothetical protein
VLVLIDAAVVVAPEAGRQARRSPHSACISFTGEAKCVVAMFATLSRYLHLIVIGHLALVPPSGYGILSAGGVPRVRFPNG